MTPDKDPNNIDLSWLNSRELAYLRMTALGKDMSEANILRQALRVYQMHDEGRLVPTPNDPSHKPFGCGVLE